MKKLLAISLALSLMLFLLFSCSENTDEPKLVPFELTDDYQVIRPEVTDEQTLKSAIGLRNTIEEVVGNSLKLSTDWVGRGEEVPVGTKEILVGGTNRPETLNAAASLRRNDFVIKKDGERIVILGGSPEATEEAVNFFIEKCISEGKLMLPENEYVRGGEYAVDKLTLNGHDIRKVSIEADGTLTTSRKSALEAVKDRISGLCGWEPGCDGSEYTIKIKAEPYGDPDTYTFAPDDSELVIGGNGEFSLLLALNDLASRIQTDGSKELDVMIAEKNVVSCPVKPLVSLNLPTEYKAMDIPSAEDGGVMVAFEKSVAELPDEVTVLDRIKIEDYPISLRNQVFVSPDGDDSADGSIDSPLATLDAALKKISGRNGAVIWLRGGVYMSDSSITVSDLASGTDVSPTFIAAYNGEAVTLSSGKKLSAKDFAHITDEKTRKRLDPKAAEKILVCDLAALGFNKADYGVLTTSDRPQLFVNGKSFVLARYPNEGGIVMGEVVDPGNCRSAHSALYEKNKDNPNGWTIKLSEDESKNWDLSKGDIWIYGAVYAEWRRVHYPVTIDKDAGTLSSTVPSEYGARYVNDNDYYFYNVFEELDAPGEWYLDREEGKLYVYPDGEIESVTLTVSNTNIIDVQNCRNIVFSGLRFAESAGNGVNMYNTYQVILQDCEFTTALKSGLTIYASKRSGVIYSRFSKNQGMQCMIGNDERAELIPENNFIQNCVFSDAVVNQVGAYIRGVGIIVSHNLFDGTTFFVNPSNECVFEYNELIYGSLTTSDSGMVYVGGGDLSCRGNHIRYNYFHDMAMSHAGVYIDDCASGQYVYGNIVEVNPKTAIAGAFGAKTTYRLHNGRECVFVNNISINATSKAFSDEANYYKPESIRWAPMRESVLSYGKKLMSSKVFTDRYPVYADYYEKMEQHAKDVLEEGYTRNDLEEWLREPAFNVYENNIVVNAKIAFNVSEAGKRTAVGLDDDGNKSNWISESSPLDKDYQLSDDSPVFAKLTGYRNVPFGKMGLCE